ncbi:MULTISPECIES: hypothetical protein [Aeromonas]|nr:MULTISPECIES: hypothetical protein [Aeromonas]EJN6955692.1 hypothetical protein [Aeromonas hydrophila]MBM0511726.1 hypothetical protein [Aeromonas hydrophila]MBW3771524.1 hypothetical protein [Aeromonas hydrophila]MBW3795453.1 hypothetical protein [Aeromonas hydrophila]MBW3801155.1 hypothetical protein [Aeromonas hydrophila]
MELNSQLTRLVRQLDAYQLNQLSPDEWLLLAADSRSPADTPDRTLMTHRRPQATFVFDTTSQEFP